MNRFNIMPKPLTLWQQMRIREAIDKAIKKGWMRELPNGELELTELGKEQALRDMVTKGEH